MRGTWRPFYLDQHRRDVIPRHPLSEGAQPLPERDHRHPDGRLPFQVGTIPFRMADIPMLIRASPIWMGISLSGWRPSPSRWGRPPSRWGPSPSRSERSHRARGLPYPDRRLPHLDGGDSHPGGAGPLRIGDGRHLDRRLPRAAPEDAKTSPGRMEAFPDGSERAPGVRNRVAAPGKTSGARPSRPEW